MQRTTRDCIAAGLAAILMCPLILGSVGGRAPELAGGAPDAGTLVEEETAPNRQAPAGDGAPPVQLHDDFKFAQAKPAEKSPAPTAEPNVPPREHEAQPRSEAQVSKPPQTVAQSTSSPTTAVNPPPLQKELPRPTPVEQQPKPVAEMSPEEIQLAVAEYRTWVYKGKVRLILEHSQVTSDQLNSVTALYALTKVDRSGNPVQQELLIDSAGYFRDDLRGALADDILTGDLRSEGQWPALLTQKALSAFGPQYLARAKFYLSDACALRIYRVLAQAVQDKTMQPGTEFVMQLRPDEAGHIGVVLLRPTFAREGTQQP